MEEDKTLITENRFGKFFIPMYLIEHHPDEVMKFLKDVLITRAEFVYSSRGIVYEGLSEHFEPKPDNEIIRQYFIEVIREHDETNRVTGISLSWSKSYV